MIYDKFGNRRFYGVYRAIVVDNNDPLSKHRLKLRIPQVFNDEVVDWAWGSFPDSSTYIPNVGEGVWAAFEGGDPSFPLWLGKFSPIDVQPNVYGSYYDTREQPLVSGANSDTIMTFSTKDAASTFGVNITAAGSITVEKNGIFRITVINQVYHTGGAGSGDYFFTWLNKQSQNVTYTGLRQRITSSHYFSINSEFIVPMTTSEIVRVYWSSDTSAMSLRSITTAGAFAPSARILISQIG